MLIRPIKDYEGYYISNKGHVFTKWVNKGVHGLHLEDEMRRLKGSESKAGYIMHKFGRSEKWEYQHRLVYETFKGEIKEGNFVRHLNDDPKDNRVENLEQGTQKENMADAIRNGRVKYGEDNPSSKLSNKEREEIALFKESNPLTPNRIIAKKYKVSRSTVDRLVRKEKEEIVL